MAKTLQSTYFFCWLECLKRGYEIIVRRKIYVAFIEPLIEYDPELLKFRGTLFKKLETAQYLVPTKFI